MTAAVARSVACAAARALLPSSLLHHHHTPSYPSCPTSLPVTVEVGVAVVMAVAVVAAVVALASLRWTLVPRRMVVVGVMVVPPLMPRRCHRRLPRLLCLLCRRRLLRRHWQPH